MKPEECKNWKTLRIFFGNKNTCDACLNKSKIYPDLFATFPGVWCDNFILDEKKTEPETITLQDAVQKLVAWADQHSHEFYLLEPDEWSGGDWQLGFAGEGNPEWAKLVNENKDNGLVKLFTEILKGK